MRDIESLRPGGLPAPLPEEPADLVWEWPDDDGRPDDPVTAKLGEGIFLHRYADGLRTCPACGDDYVSARHLEAHKRRDHGRAYE